jgi:hypothetical protein
MDLEFIEIRARMERLALKMQHEAKVHWKYEWPLKSEVKWPIQKLFTRKKQQEVKRWLRHVESLREIEEVVYICEPEVGRTLNDEEGRSIKGLIKFQGGRDEFLNF